MCFDFFHSKGSNIILVVYVFDLIYIHGFYMAWHCVCYFLLYLLYILKYIILFCYLFQVHLEKTRKNGEWNPFLSIAGPRTVLGTLLTVRRHWNAVLSFWCWCAEGNGWGFKLFVGVGTGSLFEFHLCWWAWWNEKINVLNGNNLLPLTACA